MFKTKIHAGCFSHMNQNFVFHISNSNGWLHFTMESKCKTPSCRLKVLVAKWSRTMTHIHHFNTQKVQTLLAERHPSALMRINAVADHQPLCLRVGIWGGIRLLVNCTIKWKVHILSAEFTICIVSRRGVKSHEQLQIRLLLYICRWFAAYRSSKSDTIMKIGLIVISERRLKSTSGFSPHHKIMILAEDIRVWIHNIHAHDSSVMTVFQTSKSSTILDTPVLTYFTNEVLILCL